MIRVLQSLDEVRAARRELARAGVNFSRPWRLLPWQAWHLARTGSRLFSADIIKSWDVWHALQLIEAERLPREAPIVDLGAYGSEILWVLHARGYRRLTGCDLDPRVRWMPWWSSIRYLRADATDTGLPSHSFAVVTCLSTVEHGVPARGLATEASRLLVPGGLLILTTDYDGTGTPHPAARAARAFGQPWTLFDREGLQELIRELLDAGFRYLDPSMVDTSHAARPIRWNGEDYTFVLLALRAPPG